MKLAIQETLLPDGGVKAKMEAAAKLGFAGVEFWGNEIWKREKDIAKAASETGVAVSTICSGYRGELLGPDIDGRELALEEIKRLLDVAGRLKASGLIVVPIFGGPRVPDLMPFADAATIENRLMLSVLPEMNSAAASADTYVLLEPLNRYETHYLNRLEQATALAERSRLSHVKLMADLFHMNIEEVNVEKALRAAGKMIAHVHLSDSNRGLPGEGHVDFARAFKVLREIGYDGYLAVEATPLVDGMKGLEGCAAFLREAMGTAGVVKKSGSRGRSRKPAAPRAAASVRAKPAEKKTSEGGRSQKKTTGRGRSRKKASGQPAAEKKASGQPAAEKKTTGQAAAKKKSSGRRRRSRSRSSS